MATHHDASIVAVMGQSGQGKGLFIKRRLREALPARLLIWDPMDEYGELARAQPSLSHLVHATIKRSGPRLPFAARYIPKGASQSKAITKEFAVFCALAREAKNCTVIVEELSFVTRASWAPPEWAKLCNAGRHAGIRLVAASQFPAQIDKAFLGNATEVVCFYLGEKPHRETVASKMNRPATDIEQLQKFTYLHFDRDARTVVAGAVMPPGGAAPAPLPLPGARPTASGVATSIQGSDAPPLSAA